MARNTLRPEGIVESIEIRAVADESQFQSMLDKAAKGDADALEELEARVMIPTSHPFSEYDIEQLHSEKLETGRRSHKYIVEIAMTNIGLHLAEARRRARMTQAEAAELMGISSKTLGRIERGEKSPRLEMVLELSWLYGTHIERVLGFIDEGAEQILDCYEVSTPRNRQDMVEAARIIQGGKKGTKFELNIDRDQSERVMQARERLSNS